MLGTWQREWDADVGGRRGAVALSLPQRISVLRFIYIQELRGLSSKKTPSDTLYVWRFGDSPICVAVGGQIGR